jgi:hypothetical protein
MEKNSMDLMNEALDIFKAKYPNDISMAYASFTGICLVLVDLKTAQNILSTAKEIA